MTSLLRVPKPRASYPSKPKLSDSEMTGALRVGPLLKWFFPFAVLGEVRTAQPNRMPYGLAHWYFDAEGNSQRTVQTFYSEEDARWAVSWLYRTHEDDCQCAAIFYWTPATVNCGPETGR